MKTPERLNALRNAKQTLQIRDQKITRMKQRLQSVTSVKGVEVDLDMAKKITEVIEDNSKMEELPKSDFKRIFWDQQVFMSIVIKKLFNPTDVFLFVYIGGSIMC